MSIELDQECRALEGAGVVTEDYLAAVERQAEYAMTLLIPNTRMTVLAGDVIPTLVGEVRKATATRDALVALVDALGDELAVAVSDNPHVQEHVRKALAAVGSSYEPWWLR